MDYLILGLDCASVCVAICISIPALMLRTARNPVTLKRRPSAYTDRSAPLFPSFAVLPPRPRPQPSSRARSRTIFHLSRSARHDALAIPVSALTPPGLRPPASLPASRFVRSILLSVWPLLHVLAFCIKSAVESLVLSTAFNTRFTRIHLSSRLHTV
jgi:hypothetical protein